MEKEIELESFQQNEGTDTVNVKVVTYKGWVWYVGRNVIGLGSYDPRTKLPPGDDLDDAPFVYNGRVYAEVEVGVGCLIQFLKPNGDMFLGRIAGSEVGSTGYFRSYLDLQELGRVELREGPSVTLEKGSVALVYLAEVQND